MEQWTNVHSIDQTPDVTDTIKMFPYEVYQDAAGNALVETITITGMGHGTPVDPGVGEDQCGTVAPFILDVDVCSSLYIARFWGLEQATRSSESPTLIAPR
jgi:poly(3-hydroxybutyrate) depolymerase